jgi:beta-ureidopropionase / N-carbamoyl-L-amino-acid hydrolase
MISLSQLNAATSSEFVAALSSIFEHSPWVAEQVTVTRPFATGLALHQAMCEAVRNADHPVQLALIRAHPELAGKAAVRGDLTPASSREQSGAGLSACTPEQFGDLQALNAQYQQRFEFPFVLAVKGHTPDSVIAALRARTANSVSDESRVALEEICRIARFRLADLVDEPMGEAIVAMAQELSQFSESPTQLTCSYLTSAHRGTAARIRDYMLAAGLTSHIDAVGNVVGVLPGAASDSRRLLTGSHYDTVVNAGMYDGRLGILLPIAVAGGLRRAGVKLPYDLEIIAFAEEEGVRFKSTFLGSRALVGRFDPALLDDVDAGGVTMRQALNAAFSENTGIEMAAINALARDPQQVAAFVEVHIEQGPVLLDEGLAVGVVSGIAGSVRSLLSIEGLSGHAGTVPMGLRHDAAAAGAEIVLAVERRCSAEPGLVGTVGKLEVPEGAVNVIPGRCELSIDIRSGSDAVRDAADADLDREIAAIAKRRGVHIQLRRVLKAAAVPCVPHLQAALSDAVQRVTGHAARRLPSGAGHDAMMMANLTDVGMLFVRCGNGGISHHPSETLSAADAGTAAVVFRDFLLHFKVDL